MTLIGKMMTPEISNKRKKEIKNIVLETLQYYPNPSLYIKIGEIIRAIPYVKLASYSNQIKKYNITYEELINTETKDAFVQIDFDSGRYCIYYNDIDKNIVKSNRVRWNLAHELGHVQLKHHYVVDKEKLCRQGLDDATYNYLETEADYFAQLILVPHACLGNFKIKNEVQLRILCKISGPAAHHRFIDFNKWRQNIDPLDQYDLEIFKLFFNFSFKRKCKNCNSVIIQRDGKFCPICGAKKTLEWSDSNMLFPKLETNSFKKLTICPHCQNEDTNFEGPYCQICSWILTNKCSNILCDTSLESNARYCNMCGSPSLFYNNNYLEAWDYSDEDFPIFDEDLPFS